MEDKNEELFQFLKTMYLLQVEDLEIFARIYELKLMAIQGLHRKYFGV